ncbi:MAG: AFG1 family ATPase [Alphaproteobacteria bacterium]|nr:AFG1 family ATPase [Alphaproteobacteria bacterium]
MSESLSAIYTRLVAEERLSFDPVQQAVLPLLQKLRDELEGTEPKRGLSSLFQKAPEAPKGLYLWGGVGRGKSMLMDLFHASVDIPQKRRVHFHEFMQEVHAALHQARRTGVDDAIVPVADAIIKETRLLCFDEMQISDITDAMIVGRLFQRLFKAGVVVVTTSNRVPDDLYKDGLNRQLFLPFIEQLKTHMTVHELGSETDYRQDRLAGTQLYFSPANADARQAVSRIWQAMTGGEGMPLVLDVKGHKVTLPEFHNAAARASFWDLCAQAYGAADYLAIGQAVRVLVLEDVPLLSSENYNEARRFVTLIDTLYEAHVRVIMTAADIPERLYLEGTGSFEFERTASRLREMQSADWAASDG